MTLVGTPSNGESGPVVGQGHQVSLKTFSLQSERVGGNGGVEPVGVANK